MKVQKTSRSWGIYFGRELKALWGIKTIF